MDFTANQTSELLSFSSELISVAVSTATHHSKLFQIGFQKVDNIRDKLTRKHYATDATLELFAYAAYDDFGANTLQQVRECIETCLPGSSFKRVSVFNLGGERLIFRTP